MLNLYEKCMKKRRFFGPSIWKAFCEGLGRFGEAEILDFRIFFVIFSKQILKDFLEGLKIEI